MSQIFNASEVFEMAEQIERDGGRFYRRAADSVQGEKEKGFLTRLAEMENEHEKLFVKLRRDAGLEGDKEFPDLESQTAAYLQAMAEGKVFGDIKDMSLKITPSTPVKKIIDIAIGFEKDTIVFFSAMKNLIPESLGREKIDTLIKEEISHIAILLEEKKETTENE
jgi:rubrerythrin